jgi:hypothetical protein
VDVLTYDDDDDNLFNGTPNWAAITNSFDLHGILLPTVNINHTPLEDTQIEQPYPVTIAVGISDPPVNEDSVFVMYRTQAGDPFISVQLLPTSTPGEYTGNIPSQPMGTLVEYYISVFDLSGGEYRSPTTAPLPTYFFIVGQLQIQLADSLERNSGWTVGSLDDDAVRGVWVRVDPNGTYADSDPTYPYQPEDDHTADPGAFCFITGQHPLGEPNNGYADVDSGRTTVTTPVFDLSTYDNPVVEYFRWFTTNRNIDDTFHVQISSDGGANWIPLEVLTQVENFWKKSRFLVSQLFSQFNQVRLRFIAVDLGGGSLVEGGVDDLTIYSVPPVGVDERPEIPHRFAVLQNYPNPFNGRTELSFELAEEADVALSIFDISGRRISSAAYPGMAAGAHTILWDSKSAEGIELPSGIYLYKIQAGNKSECRKMVLLK